MDFANEVLDNGGRKLDCYQSVCFIISILFASMNHDLKFAERIPFAEKCSVLFESHILAINRLKSSALITDTMSFYHLVIVSWFLQMS